ncbi:MAG TPA: hypothetical protein DCO79_11900 [Spirochaeta sp.]|nr:hypothetical protein [Spirochaeta sp.]
MELKKKLKTWFIIHFTIDVIFAAVLFIAPVTFLSFMGWESVDSYTARLVAAALFGIGIESLLARKSTLESFKSMLMLKVIWSAAAVIGTAISLIENAQGRPLLAWGILLIFFAFNIVWTRFFFLVRRRLSEVKNADNV